MHNMALASIEVYGWVLQLDKRPDGVVFPPVNIRVVHGKSNAVFPWDSVAGQTLIDSLEKHLSHAPT